VMVQGAVHVFDPAGPRLATSDTTSSGTHSPTPQLPLVQGLSGQV
jgi:hypothetical protein